MKTCSFVLVPYNLPHAHSFPFGPQSMSHAVTVNYASIPRPPIVFKARPWAYPVVLISV